MRVQLSADGKFLEAAFGAPRRTLSWAIVGGGFGVHERVVWHYVRRAELGFRTDAKLLLEQRLAQHGYGEAVGLLTARDVRRYAHVEAEHAGVVGRALVTVGLGNALRAGDAVASAAPPVGTINVLCEVSEPLSDGALIEALGLISEARAAALLALAFPSTVSGEPASGTGTDCSVVACPSVTTAPVQIYAGKHTAVGYVIGQSVLSATRRAAEDWLREQTRHSTTNIEAST